MTDRNLLYFRTLVGEFITAPRANISNNVKMPLYRNRGLYIPYLDYCDYAITPQHTYPGFTILAGRETPSRNRSERLP